MIKPDFFDHLIALFFGLLLPVLSGVRSAQAFKTLRLNKWQRKRFYLSNSLFLWMITLVVLASWFLHGRDAELLGITRFPFISTPVLLFTLLFAGLYTADSFHSLRNTSSVEKIKEDWKQRAPFLPVDKNELPAYIIMCITAGICEEIIFRGFLITYVRSFFELSRYATTWAVVIPAIVFAAAHYYQEMKAVVKIALLSVLFGFIFIYSGSLWIVIVLHFGIDLVGGLLSIRYLDEEKEEPEGFPGLDFPEQEYEKPGEPSESPGETGITPDKEED